MGLFGSGSSGVQCLTVDDVSVAVGHYRDVLGFEQVAMIGGIPSLVGVVRKYGSTLLLQRAEGVACGARPRSGPPWDAVVQVPDVEVVRRELVGRGAVGLSDVSTTLGWGYFEFQDCCGNLICVGQVLEPFLKELGTPPSRPFAGLRSRWQQARNARQEREHLGEFLAFYEGLVNKDDIFYMFFTSGLLHWVAHAESFVPADVNLVLIGSALTPDEQRWLRENLRRPFHHIRLPVDDISAWEFLFATNERNFGWVDIDCFVLNGGLFEEMTALAPGHSMNCTWSMESGYGFRVARTHFLFVNVEAIRAVAMMGVRPSAAAYDWGAWPRGFRQRRCFMKVPTRAERRLLLEVMPADRKGRPQVLHLAAHYDTLVVFQLLARAAGYPIHPVRPLGHRCQRQVDGSDAQEYGAWMQDMSDELFHLSGVSYYMDHDFGTSHAHFLVAELAMLQDTVGRLPENYSAHQAALRRELAELGVPPESAAALGRQYLAATPGLSEDAADRILGTLPFRST